MGKEDPELFTEDKEEIRFITSAIRNDLKDGVCFLLLNVIMKCFMHNKSHFITISILLSGFDIVTDSILASGQSQIDRSIIILLIIGIVGCFLIILSYIIFALPWRKQILFIESQSNSLIELIQKTVAFNINKDDENGFGDELENTNNRNDSDNKELHLLNTMITKIKVFDNGREHVFELLMQLLQEVRQQENIQNILALHALLMTEVNVLFKAEEEIMKRWASPNKKKKISYSDFSNSFSNSGTLPNLQQLTQNMNHQHSTILDLTGSSQQEEQQNVQQPGDNKLASYMTRIMPSITSQSTSSSQQTILSIATPRLKEGLISYYDSQAGLRHRRDHFLLRQRLTVLGDVLKLQIESHSSVAVRFLTSIFDRHFGEHDILFSESIGLTGIESENLLFKKRMDIHQKAFASKQKLRLNVLSKLSLHSKDDSDSDSDSSSSSSQDNEQQQIQNKKGKSKLKQSPLKYRSSQQNIISPINKSTQIGGSKKNNKKTRTS